MTASAWAGPDRATNAGRPVPAAALINGFNAGAALFCSPGRSLLGAGPPRPLSLASSDERGTALQVSAQLHEADRRARESGRPVLRAVAVGAIPYDQSRGAQLVVPDRLTWGAPRSAETPLQLKVAAPPAIRSVTPIPSGEAYVRAVQQVVGGIHNADVAKVVLARCLQLAAEEPVRVDDVVRRLARAVPDGYLFAIPLPGDDRRTRYLVGASPELLVSRVGRRVSTNPLAGSVPRSHDPVEDQRRQRALLTSDKDRHEHDFVREAVRSALAPFCSTLRVSEPTAIATPTMWHLSTTVTGRLDDVGVSSLELALALHPTPAVCGTPTAMAQAMIGASEPFDRGHYAGLVGWCDATGDGEWAVTLRCAEIDGNAATLFAGAGIVAGSDAHAELAETSGKFKTWLTMLGVEEGGVVRPRTVAELAQLPI